MAEQGRGVISQSCFRIVQGGYITRPGWPVTGGIGYCSVLEEAAPIPHSAASSCVASCSPPVQQMRPPGQAGPGLTCSLDALSYVKHPASHNTGLHT
jgi:hypothetical protein